MKIKLCIAAIASLYFVNATQANDKIDNATVPEIVHFENQALTLGGELYKPAGNGPFPAVLYNHGSASGMWSSDASKVLGPLFASRGWVFFMPYRRGQGLSAKAGPYISDEIAAAQRRGGMSEAVATMVRLHSTDHLQDQLAGLQWLKTQAFVQANTIAVAGQSFGGIQTVLGVAAYPYCAAVDAAGGAESWSKAAALQDLMRTAVRSAQAPVFFFQAENDYDLAPSKVLHAEMQQAGKTSEMKIYPPFGKSDKDGHSFSYRGSDIWFEDVFAFMSKHCRR
ncbi:alpha/beta hydrolase family protein [Undibacterium sp. Ji49W]|uniref:alpha/beta hydrolase family protein n=1 Tax=Undibacterium sp. Ji49W TaxID=3413040 RepID=UPI003BF105FE